MNTRKINSSKMILSAEIVKGTAIKQCLFAYLSDIQLIRSNQLTAAGSTELTALKHSAALNAVQFAVVDRCRRSRILRNKGCSAGCAEFTALKSLATGRANKTVVLCRGCSSRLALHGNKVAAAGSAELALIQDLAANLAHKFA